MTKNAAHKKFIAWMHEHGSDNWTIFGGDKPRMMAYMATATDIKTGESVKFCANYDGDGR